LVDATSTAASGSASAAKTYEVLIERMKMFNKLVECVAEVCPMTMYSATCLQRPGPSICEDRAQRAIRLREGTLPRSSGVRFSDHLLT
jgi:hypothetical protein